MAEIWKDIIDTDGMYQVSNIGRVRVRDYRVAGYWRILNQVRQDTSYFQVIVYYNGKLKRVSVHRLVATAFLPNPNNYPVVNHKDQDGGNNHVDNLEWCTYQYNATYADAVEKRRQKRTGVYNADNAVLQYTKEGTFVARHKSARDASFAMCGDRIKKAEVIVQVCRGARNMCCGFQWRYDTGDFPLQIPRYSKTKWVEQLTRDGEHVAFFESSYKAQAATGVQPAQILKCCKGERDIAGDSRWRFHNPDD